MEGFALYLLKLESAFKSRTLGFIKLLDEVGSELGHNPFELLLLVRKEPLLASAFILSLRSHD